MCKGGKTAMNGFFLLRLDLYSGQVTVNFRLCKPEIMRNVMCCAVTCRIQEMGFDDVQLKKEAEDLSIAGAWL
jgi:hypothetical protein